MATTRLRVPARPRPQALNVYAIYVDAPTRLDAVRRLQATLKDGDDGEIATLLDLVHEPPDGIDVPGNPA